ncbi:sulfotransferase 1C4-like [Eriocheir sinensis]|uniref:sulfotransferase 1C4-like n=1 Tax=Eriocheir sinensis TaxID=95602 RepID=UPI0021C849D9|nr:sulfotransferase 1C4-like [Eriocheir sinensis]
MVYLMSGHRAELLEGEELSRYKKDWSAYRSGLVRLHPGRWLFPSPYLFFADRIYNFKFQASDVVVMTYPKCGTTWTQEIISGMRSGIDLTNASEGAHPIRPFLDLDMLVQDHLDSENSLNVFRWMFESACPGKDINAGLMLQVTEATPQPRTIKTHLPFSLLPPNLLETCKVVFVARNPKDMVVSLYHHSKWTKLYDFQSSLEEFVEYFVNDNVVYGPYWLLLKEALEKRDHPNLHFMQFEDMKRDIMAEMRKLNGFLNTQLSEKTLQTIAEYNSFDTMKARFERHFSKMDAADKTGALFFRKGKAGGWKQSLTQELKAKMDKWTADNIGSTGVEFKYS